METAPTAEAVYQGVYALYNNPDNAEKEKASKFLELLQKSVSIYTYTRILIHLLLACKNNNQYCSFHMSFVSTNSHSLFAIARFSRGQLPTSCSNKSAISIRATLPPRRCAAKSRTRFTNYPKDRTSLCAIRSSRTSSRSPAKQNRPS